MARGLRDDDADDHERLGLSAHGDDDGGALENATIGIAHVNLRRRTAAAVAAVAAAGHRRAFLFFKHSRVVTPNGPHLSMLMHTATSATVASGPRLTTDA